MKLVAFTIETTAKSRITIERAHDANGYKLHMSVEHAWIDAADLDGLARAFTLLNELNGRGDD